MIRGFSILETLIVVTIVAIVASIIFFSFSDLRRDQVLNAGTEEVVTLLTQARSRTLSSVDNSSWGVYVENDKLTLFRGGTFPGVGDPNNQEVLLNPLLTISNVSLNGGGSSVVFERLTGRTNQVGEITVTLVSGSGSRVIHVESTGLINIQS